MAKSRKSRPDAESAQFSAYQEQDSIFPVVQKISCFHLWFSYGDTGCGTLYGYHYGAGHYDKVMQIFKYVFCLCAGYMLLLCVAAQLIPEAFARIFTKEDRLILLSASCIQKYTCGLLGVAIQYAIVDGLTAMGQIRLALPISFFRKILYVVCVFLIPMFCSLENVFYAETISDLAGAGVTVIVFITIIVPLESEKFSAII